MILTEKETTAIEDLKTQEQACIEKYTKYSNQAKDPVLKELFEEIARDEQKHFDSLDQVLKGKFRQLTAMIQRGRIIVLPQHTIRLAILRTRKLTVIWLQTV